MARPADRAIVFYATFQLLLSANPVRNDRQKF